MIKIGRVIAVTIAGFFAALNVLLAPYEWSPLYMSESTCM
jgi:hypothetical protein